jgi:hypothetical protein
MIGAGGSCKCSGRAATLAILLLFWPRIDRLLGSVGWTRDAKPAQQ